MPGLSLAESGPNGSRDARYVLCDHVAFDGVNVCFVVAELGCGHKTG